MVQGVVFESEQMEPTKTFDLLDGGVMGRLAAIRRLIRAHTGAILTNTCGDIAP
jgi:hypothetical protein